MVMATERFLAPAPGPLSSCFEQISGRIARLFGMKCRLFDDAEPFPTASSPWDQLMASPSLGFYSATISSAGKVSPQKGALIASLLDFTPRLKRYLPAQPNKWPGHGYYSQEFVGFNDKRPTCSMSAAEVASLTCRPPLIIATLPPMVTLCCVVASAPAVTLELSVPTIVVTDVDGPQLGGSYDLQAENFKAMKFGQGLLWREWRGKFSPPGQHGGEVESGDEMYFEDQPNAGMEEVGKDFTRYIKAQGSGCQNVDQQIEAVTLVFEEGPRPTIQETKEWWEMGSDEEDDGIGEDSDSDDEEDDSGSDEESSGSEDGDDEHENDFDDDSGEDSDLDEESEVTTSNPLDPETPVPSPHQTKSILLATFQVHTEEVGAFGQGTKATEKHSDASLAFSSSSSSPYLSMIDSDFESCNSSTTTSSISPTPITPASPFSIPLDDCALQRHYLENRDGDYITEFLVAGKPYRSMFCLDLELGAARRAEWEMENGYEGMVLAKTLNMEGLDLVGWNRQRS